MNWNDTPDGRAFVQDVAKRIVADLGADELEIFPELAEDFFAGELTPERVTGEDPLGFGLNETLEAISPAALASASAVVGWALGEILKLPRARPPTSSKPASKRCSRRPTGSYCFCSRCCSP